MPIQLKKEPPSLTVRILLTGGDAANIEADLLIPIDPPSLAQDSAKLYRWGVEKTSQVLHDFKHSQSMVCEICREFATEMSLPSGLKHASP